MTPVVRIVADKVGVAGSLVSTMSCAMCFPAVASIGPVAALIGWLAFVRGWLPADGARGVLSAGLIIMLLAAIRDLVLPASRYCAVDGAGLAVKRG